jgi:hypothetical protein
MAAGESTILRAAADVTQNFTGRSLGSYRIGRRVR